MGEGGGAGQLLCKYGVIMPPPLINLKNASSQLMIFLLLLFCIIGLWEESSRKKTGRSGVRRPMTEGSVEGAGPMRRRHGTPIPLHAEPALERALLQTG